MFLGIASGARPILASIESRPLTRAETATIGARAWFGAPEPRLLAGEPRGFTAGQLARSPALQNPRALIVLATIDLRRWRRCHRDPMREDGNRHIQVSQEACAGRRATSGTGQTYDREKSVAGGANIFQAWVAIA
jgi:hypothetical protein